MDMEYMRSTFLRSIYGSETRVDRYSGTGLFTREVGTEVSERGKEKERKGLDDKSVQDNTQILHYRTYMNILPPAITFQCTYRDR